MSHDEIEAELLCPMDALVEMLHLTELPAADVAGLVELLVAGMRRKMGR